MQEILAVNTRDLETQKRRSGPFPVLEAVAKEISKQSAMLRQPMANLVENAQDGGPVANSLISLQEQVNVINPNRVDFTMSTLRRLLAKIPVWERQYQDGSLATSLLRASSTTL